MKKFLNNIKHEAEHIRMSAAEKSAMRAALFGAPAQQSPYVFASYFSYNVRMSLAGLLLFVLAGAGSVSAAAQGALPGDTLYPIKLLVNERAQLALAPNDQAKALVQEEIAGRRVEEAQTLAQQGRLDAKTAQTLSADFDAHASEALALAGPDDATVSVSAEAQPLAVEAPPESSKKAAPMRTMIVRSMAADASGEASSTEATSSPQEMRTPFVKKHERGERATLRASLEIKGELLKALKDRAVKEEDAQTPGEEGQ